MFLKITKLVEDFVYNIFMFDLRVLQKILVVCLHSIKDVSSKIDCSKHEFILYLKLYLIVSYVQVTLKQESIKVLSLSKILFREFDFN